VSPRKDPAARQGRLDELREKVQDEAYIAGAILRIAQVLSAELATVNGVPHVGRKSR